MEKDNNKKMLLEMMYKVGGMPMKETDGYGVGADDGSDEAFIEIHDIIFGREDEYGPMDVKQTILSLLDFIRKSHDYNPSIVADVMASELKRI